MTQGKHTYLVARVSSATVNTLAAFEAEGEDREAVDLCDEPNHNNEASPAWAS